MLTTLIEFLRDNPDPTEQEVRIAISGNLCRCTGYQNIVTAALDAAKRLREQTVRPVNCADTVRAAREGGDAEPDPARGRKIGIPARVAGTTTAQSSSWPSASTISATG